MARKSEEDWYKVALGRNTDGLSTLNKAIVLNKNAARDLGVSLLANVNVVNKFSEVVKRAEKQQLKALSLGTSLNQFVEENTKAIGESIVAQQDMTEILLTSFDAGLRNNTDGLNKLLGTMKFLDQNFKLGITTFADLGAITGDSQSIQAKLAETIKTTNKDYGISQERLIRGLNSLQGTFETFNIYGPQAIESLGNLKLGLMGMTGGKDISSKQLDIWLGMADAMNIQQQTMLGILEPMKDIRDGTATAAQQRSTIMKVGKEFRKQSGDNDIQAAALRDIYGSKNIDAILGLTSVFKKDFKLNEASRAKENALQDTIKSKQVAIDKFYQELAPQIHGVVTRVLPALLAMQGVGAAGGLLRKGKKALAGKGMGAKLSTIGMGATRGIPGLLVGLGVAFWPEITAMLSDINKSGKESVENLRDLNAVQNPDVNYDRGLSMAARIASETVNSTIDPQTQEQMLVQLKRIANNQARLLTAQGNNTSNTKVR